MKKIKRIISLGIITTAFALTGCTELNDTQENALTGAALGAAVGAGVGAAAGSKVGTGVAIGAASGAVGGALITNN